VSFSPVLTFYRGASWVAGAGASAWLLERAREGKEDPERLRERFGRYAQARPPGRLIWLHAASVGESSVALALIEALAARDTSLSFLLSTGTRTSADLVARRAPLRTTHVYGALDRIDCVRRFLKHWRPDLGVFLESELWPNLILEAQAHGVKLALVNARMSPKSLRRWTRWSTAGRRLLGAFSFVSAADTRTAAALRALCSAEVRAVGNLKLAAPAPRVDARARAALAAEIGARPVWLAASTHQGEDEIALAAHARLQTSFPDALLIVAPRHPERGEAVARLAGGAPRRSLSEPIGASAAYIADTLGEMGTLYDTAPVALVAGSLLLHLKGHNPIEPAKLGAAIITGPHIESFEDVFDALFAAGGAVKVEDAPGLAEAVARLWRDAEARARQLGAARAIADHGAEAFAETVEQLLAMAPPQRESAHAPA
jgi:3-deoxy-D-manno-octulosonic-acid transferase